MSSSHQLANTLNKPSGVLLTPCLHRQGLPSWRMESLEADDLEPEGNQNKLGPLEDLLEVATPMGSVGQCFGLA